MGAYIKQRLKGAFALFLLFGRGMDAFSGTKRDGLISCLAPLALAPIGIVAALMYPPRGMQEGYSAAQIIGINAVYGAVYTVLFLMVIFGVGIMFKRMDRLWLFVESLNWLGLAGSIVALPFLALAALEWAPRDEMDRVFIVLNLYLHIAIAVAADRTFKLNWQLAGAIACCLLVVGQESWGMAYQWFGVPYPWDY